MRLGGHHASLDVHIVFHELLELSARGGERCAFCFQPVGLAGLDLGEPKLGLLDTPERLAEAVYVAPQHGRGSALVVRTRRVPRTGRLGHSSR